MQLRAQIAAIEKADRRPAPVHEPRSEATLASCTSGCIARGDNDEDARAFSKIHRLVAVRERASEELRQRLRREGFSEEATEKALERALMSGLVDDSRFAEALVRTRLASGKGMRGIEAELEKWGIDPGAAIAHQEETCGEDAEVQRALEVLRRRPPKAKNQRDAAYRRLMQKGYGSSIASTAARLWNEQQTSHNPSPES